MAHCGRWSWPECSMLSAGDKATSAASLGDASNVIVPWSSPQTGARQDGAICLLSTGAPTDVRSRCIHAIDSSAARTRHDPPSHVADESCAASATFSSPSSLLQMPVCHPPPSPRSDGSKIRKSGRLDHDLVRSRTFRRISPAQPTRSPWRTCASLPACVWRAKPLLLALLAPFSNVGICAHPSTRLSPCTSHGARK